MALAVDLTDAPHGVLHARMQIPASGGSLTLRGLAGALDTSRIERIDATLAFAREPVVLSAAGAAQVDLDELYPWVAALLPRGRCGTMFPR
jgi:hypothetical protein